MFNCSTASVSSHTRSSVWSRIYICLPTGQHVTIIHWMSSGTHFTHKRRKILHNMTNTQSKKQQTAVCFKHRSRWYIHSVWSHIIIGNLNISLYTTQQYDVCPSQASKHATVFPAVRQKAGNKDMHLCVWQGGCFHAAARVT